jgi:uncharacterized protein DUF732
MEDISASETQAAYAWQLEETGSILEPTESRSWRETFLTISKAAALAGLVILAARGTDWGQRVEDQLLHHGVVAAPAPVSDMMPRIPAIPRCWGGSTCPDYENDAGFVDQLELAQLPHSDGGRVVTAGRAVCSDLHHGVTPKDTRSDLEAARHLNQKEAIKFFAAAQAYICPDTQSR